MTWVKRHFFFLLLVAVRGLGQTFNFQTYAEDQGLPNTYVYAISQAANGSLFLSTGEGLCVYNGRDFTTFTNKIVSTNFVGTHLVDSRNIPWMGFSQNGLAFIRGNRFNYLSHTLLKDHKVNQLAEDKLHNIWVATAGAGLLRVDTSFHLKPIHCPEVNETNCLLFNSDQYLMAGTTSGLFLLSATTNTVKVLCDVPELRGKTIRQIIPVYRSRRQFWVLVEGEGIYRINREGACFRVVASIYSELQSKSGTISFIYTDRSGNLWASLFGEGLRRVVFNTYNDKFSVFRIDKANGLKNLHVQSIFEDYEGNMWFGTFGGGLIEKPVEKFAFYGVKEGIEQSNIRCMVRDRNGSLWLGNNEGFSRFDPEHGSYTHFGAGNGPVSESVNALELDNDGNLWIGTHGKGVFTYTPQTGVFRHFSGQYKSNQLSVNRILRHHNEMVIATEEGISNYAASSGDIRYYTTYEGLLHNNVLHLFYDSRNRLWISSHGTPPYFLSMGRDTALKDIPDLNSFNINAVTEDHNGNIWIATEGDGVFRYDGKRTLNYRMKDGLLSNYCYGIEVDRNNSVWVTHKNGLSEKKPLKRDFNAVTSAEGLLLVENNKNAVCRDRNGDLWFGTSEGIVHYNATVGAKNNVEPRLSILNIKISGKPYAVNRPIDISYGYHSVHIEFLAVSLTNPEKIRYKTRLLGIDSAWKVTSAATPFVDYPALSNGSYRFQVMASNSEGLWTQRPVEISFVIREPVWKKVWFYVLLLALIVSVTYVIIMWRTANLKRSQMLLQTKVKQKTFLLQREKEEVEKIKVELEVKNKDITDSINYARRIQDSLLPPDELLSELFDENYFIFYRPKDIVSGDFYWAARVETNDDRQRKLSLACVADCTGHGVPGAFLSIVASSFLKQSLSEKFVTHTGEVLDYLNHNISSTLNQSSRLRNRIRDGMDLAIIAIDYRHHKLYYSGANNPLYIFRKTDNNTELFVLSPTKQAIGSVSEKKVRYESQVFDIVAGDTIYMFTDGYPDQFGGEKDKKLNYRRFREILQSASELPMSLQRNFLEDSFEKWKGKRPQTDDVCIMGIKI